MNEWGIPDWRNPAAYGGVKNWHLWRWRWEFIRRREDYRRDFDRSAAGSYLEQSESWTWFNEARPSDKQVVGPRPNEPGFCARGRRYGYLELPNPRISEQPLAVLEPADDRDEAIVVHRAQPEPRVGRNAPVEVPPGSVAVVFDLNRPMGPQIRAAQDWLIREQKRLHGKRIGRRRHPEKWLTYLRVLDAREAGSSWAQIAETVLETKGSHTAQDARDVHGQAHALCYNF